MPKLPSALIAASALLVALTLITFAPVRQFDFVHYDDFEYIVLNPHIAGGVTAAGARWAIEHAYDGTGGPLTWLSHMTDVELYGLSAGGHHLTSVGIHTAAALLLLFVLFSATGSVWRSTFVAAMFAVHPLHVESVAWVAERKDVLSGFCWFATIAAYVRYARQLSVARYVIVVVLFALGLVSKPMVVTLPFVLLLLDIWPLRRLSFDQATLRTLRPLILEKLPLVVLGLVASYFTIQAQQQGGAIATVASVPLTLRASNAIVSYAAYLGRMFWPTGLIPYYPLPPSVPSTAVIGAVVLLIGITTLAVWSLRRWPWIFVGWFWYVGTLCR